MAIRGGILYEINNLKKLTESLWAIYKHQLKYIGSIDDLNRLIKESTGISNAYSKVIKGQITNLDDLQLLYKFSSAAFSVVNERIMNLMKGRRKLTKEQLKQLKTQMKLRSEIGRMLRYLTAQGKTLTILYRRMSRYREISFSLLPAMFAMQSIGRKVSDVWETMVGQAFDMSIVLEDWLWITEDLAEELGTPLAVILDAYVTPTLEKIVEWISSLPEETKLAIAVTVTGFYLLTQLGSMFFELTVAYYGLRSGIEWLVTNFPQLGSAASKVSGALGGMKTVAGVALVSLVSYFGVLTLGQQLLKMFGLEHNRTAQIVVQVMASIAGIIPWLLQYGAQIWSSIIAIKSWIVSKLQMISVANLAKISLSQLAIALGALIGGFLIGYGLARLFINAFGPWARILMPLIGIVWSLVAAIAALYGVLSWGTAIPLILAGISAAVGGVLAAQATMEAAIPHLQGGGIIARGGLAVLHTGEEVTPALITRRRREEEVPTTVNVYIQAPIGSKEIADYLVDEIEARIERHVRRSE